jgi:hypothetical protein
VQVRDGQVDIAYPFSATPTPFVVWLADWQKRYACCAIDALGIAPMLGQPVHIRSQCHHCGTSLELSVEPHGPGPDAEGVMVWVGTRQRVIGESPRHSEPPSTSSGRKST